MSKPIVTIDARMISFSGIGTYIQNLIPRVIEKMDDIQFCILGKKNELICLEKYNNVETVECNVKIYSIKEQFVLLKKIPEHTVVFWSPHYNIPILYRGLLLVTVHDVFHLAMKQFLSSKLQKYYAKIMFKMVALKADKILTVSNFTKSQIIKYLKYKNENKIIVTHNGVDHSWFFDASLNNEKKNYIIYVGNVKPHKNLIKLLEAFEILQKREDIRLIIVGKKEGFLSGDSQVLEYAKKFKDKILFTGYVNDERLKKLVRDALIFVFPSLYEGFGLPPLEAMASATLVAVSDIVPLREVCGNCAAYFDPRDAKDIANTLEKLIHDKNDNRRILGIQRAAEFSWDKCAEQTQFELRNLLNNR